MLALDLGQRNIRRNRADTSCLLCRVPDAGGGQIPPASAQNRFQTGVRVPPATPVALSWTAESPPNDSELVCADPSCRGED